MKHNNDDDDTLRMLSDAAAAFAKPDAQRTRTARDQHQGCDPAVWRDIAAMGWLAATLPEAKGGLGVGLPAGTTIARRLGYAGHHEPFVAAGLMAVECLAASGSDAAPLLTAVADGQQLAGLAWQPADGALEPDATQVVGTPSGERTTLSGVCRFVAVPQADVFIVAAKTRNQLALYRVPRRAAGLLVEPEAAADGTMLGRLTLSGMQLGADALLAQGEAASTALERALDAGVLATSAELLGIMERALELTLEYLKTRHQFGQPIGAFQALQHRAVDMWIQKQLTAAALRSALKVFDDPAADVHARRLAASSVKARASQAALFVCGQSVQLHGAIGFTDECELGVCVNRGLTLAARYGNAAQHRRRYGALSLPAHH